MPRLAVDPTAQKLYVSEGFPAGNRISIWDVTPGNLETGMLASDLLGHETADGAPDFDSRIPQGRLDGRSLAAARAVALDPMGHRLFVADEYNHRVVVWQLDELNRVSNRSARWVLGQPDLRSSFMQPASATNMTVPLAVAYDTGSKRLFVGDGYHNRVLVYDGAPGTLTTGMPASVVVGQQNLRASSLGRAGRSWTLACGWDGVLPRIFSRWDWRLTSPASACSSPTARTTGCSPTTSRTAYSGREPLRRWCSASRTSTRQSRGTGGGLMSGTSGWRALM